MIRKAIAAALLCLAALSPARAVSPNEINDVLSLCSQEYGSIESVRTHFENSGWNLQSENALPAFLASKTDAQILASLADGSFGDLVKANVSARLADFSPAEGLQHLQSLRDLETPEMRRELRNVQTSRYIRLRRGEGPDPTYIEIAFTGGPRDFEQIRCFLFSDNQGKTLEAATMLGLHKQLQQQPLISATLSSPQTNTVSSVTLLPPGAIFANPGKIRELLGELLHVSALIIIEQSNQNPTP